MRRGGQYHLWTAEQAKQFANLPSERKKKGKANEAAGWTAEDAERMFAEAAEIEIEHPPLAANPEWERQRKLEKAREARQRRKAR